MHAFTFANSLTSDGYNNILQVYGTGYSFSKSVSLSPRSKVKDISTKKNLASSISALRQQVRNLTNKRKNTINGSPSNTTTTEADVVRKQNTGDITINTPTTITNTTTQAGVVRMHSTADNNKASITTTITTTTMQGGLKSRMARVLNSDSQKETTAGGEKAVPVLQSSVKNPSVSISPGLSRVVTHTTLPTSTQGKGGTVSPQGKHLPVKRKMGVSGPAGGVKVARVPLSTEGQLSDVPGKDTARLASQPRRAVTSGAKE